MGAIPKPYPRIIRCHTNGGYHFASEYILDPLYAQGVYDLLISYNSIVTDLQNIFNYIAPSDDNSQCYGEKIYQLLLRACTEVEANFKGILSANGYSKSGRWNITDYSKVEKSSFLSDFKVTFNVWNPGPKSIIPFAAWKTNQTLKWYQAYNHVKHNRATSFKEATLENAVDAVAGLFVVLFSQFGVNVFNPYNEVNGWEGNRFQAGYQTSMFSIESRNTYTEEEMYGFTWEILKKDYPTNCFDKFPF